MLQPKEGHLFKYIYTCLSMDCFFIELALKNPTQPVKPQPVRPQPVRPQPVKPQPVRPQPVRPQPVRPQPVKLAQK
jgi:hypothetical protein